MIEPDRHERARGNGSRHPWANAPTSELGDQVLPRWFVLTAIAAALAATAVAVVAFASIGRDDLPAAQRRPPPDANFTTAVGAVDVAVPELQHPARGSRVQRHASDAVPVREVLCP